VPPRHKQKPWKLKHFKSKQLLIEIACSRLVSEMATIAARFLRVHLVSTKIMALGPGLDKKVFKF